MKKFNIDWSYMKKEMVVLATCFFISTCLLAASQVYLSNADEGYKKQNISRHEVEENGRKLMEDIRLAKLYTIPFNILIENGFIGEERRLDWVETLREATRSIRLNKTNYRIEPKFAVTPEYIHNSGSYTVYESKMNIKLDLLHEGDLLYVLKYMSKRAPGTFHTESCVLERKQEPFTMLASSTNVNAECWLSWYTLDATQQDYVDEYE